MSTNNSSRRSSRSLLGAVLLAMLASLGACATSNVPRRGFASGSVEESSEPERWGFTTYEPPAGSSNWSVPYFTRPRQSVSSRARVQNEPTVNNRCADRAPTSAARD